MNKGKAGLCRLLMSAWIGRLPPPSAWDCEPPPPDWTKKQSLGVPISAFLLLEDAFLASSVRIWTVEQSPREAGFTGNHGLFAKILPEA